MTEQTHSNISTRNIKWELCNFLRLNKTEVNYLNRNRANLLKLKENNTEIIKKNPPYIRCDVLIKIHSPIRK